MKVFIGSSAINKVEEKTLIYTLIEKAKVKASDIFILDATSKNITDLNGDVLFTCPYTLKGSTEFSWMRFLIPEFCKFEGKALYLDSDIVVKSELSELASLVDDSDFAAVPTKDSIVGGMYRARILSTPTLKKLDTPYLSSVLVINCARLKNKFSFTTLNDVFTKKELTYAEIMFFSKPFLNKFNYTVKQLPAVWNCLDYDSSNAKIVHFTELKTQPWFSVFNPAGPMWYRIFLQACNAGYVRNVDLEQSFSAKTLSKRVMLMPYIQFSRMLRLKYYLLVIKDYLVETPLLIKIYIEILLRSIYYRIRY